MIPWGRWARGHYDINFDGFYSTELQQIINPLSYMKHAWATTNQYSKLKENWINFSNDSTFQANTNIDTWEENRLLGLGSNQRALDVRVNSVLDQNITSHYHSKIIKYIIKIIVKCASTQWPLGYNKNLNPNDSLSLFIYKKFGLPSSPYKIGIFESLTRE